MSLTSSDAPRSVARALQAPVVSSLDPAVAEQLERIDRRFAARVAAWESGPVEAENAHRFVTPWPDLLAMLAVASAMGAAAGAGRLTGGTEFNTLPVVAPTVIVSLAIAFVCFLIGAAFARRERGALLAQYENSRAVERAGVLWASVLLGSIAVIAMVVRLVTDTVIVSAVVALGVSVVTLAVSVGLAVSAQRTAYASAAKGRLIRRPRATTTSGRRYEAISASEDARDEAATVFETVPPAERERVEEAYAAAVAEVAARRILPAKTLKRLRPGDWIAARYDVET